MANYFDEDSNGSYFKDEPGFDEENEAARLASMHEGEILNDDGTVYIDPDDIADEDNDDADIA